MDRVDNLREIVRDVREVHPFEIVAWVVLPEHLIRDDLDRQRHIDSVHDNPLEQGDVQRAIDCRFSSFHRDLQHG
ncbi:MAG: hypothetical protein N838_27730 [Thiohalocapsa sp. PB-PSB1]|nr:MAG: hypothetical protein N838_27730 [Thiohalocapsa sp. PB-PSB1]